METHPHIISLKKIAALIAAVSFLLLVAGCNGVAPAYKDIDYHVGSQGLILELPNDETLDTVYENTVFPFSITVENQGAYDITGEEAAVLTVGFDPFYVGIKDGAQLDNVAVGKSNIVSTGLILLGRSRFYPSGSKLFFYFPYFQTKNITGERAKPQTQVFASICYPYSTTLSTMVCVDFDVYKDEVRSQVCRQSDLSFSGQGAPVAVTQVEVENLPQQNNIVKPVYTIHLENIGRGNVLSPVNSQEEVERVCTGEALTSADFNSVRVEAVLSNNVKLECIPELVRLTEQEGVSRCTVRDEDLESAISWRQNYNAALTINLSYVYTSTIRKDIEIRRINPYGDLNAQKVEGCLPFQIEKDEGCVNKCQYCAENPGDGACSQENSKFEINWNPSFDCRCSMSTCEKLFPKGLCIPNINYCPPASYCCANSCTTSELRSIEDGTCYPKCGVCSTIKATCICGDNLTQNIMSMGSCAKDFTMWIDASSCTNHTREVTAAQKEQSQAAG